MNSTHAHLLLPLLLAAACKDPVKDETSETGDPRPPWVLGTVLDTEGPATLATVDTPWGEQIYLLRVEGSHYDMGYQYGRLTGEMMMDLWWTYMTSIGAEMGGLDAEYTDQILGGYLDKAWGWFEPNTPSDYLEEFEGVADGLAAAGVTYGEGEEDLVKVPRRIVTLIDLAMSSYLDFDDIMGIVDFLNDGYTGELLEYYGVEGQARPRELNNPWFNCSFFAAWGDRTDDGGQYTTRNMDFSADTGIYKHAMLATYVPDDGVPYVSISWLGASLGVLAGISQEGIEVGAVGSSSPYERLNTEPAVIRAREALENAVDLESAIPYLKGTVGDGIIRAPTIGYNALVAWGDPRNDGAGAEAVILETNGLETGVHHHKHDCTVEDALLKWAYDGTVESEWTSADHPEWANSEADAFEIDGAGNVRTFQVDGSGQFVLDGSGNYIEDPSGQPLRTGYPEPCALYRGDEAMSYGVRIHQDAANGPATGGTGLMVQSGSWRNRYWPSREMTRAWAAGTAYTWDGVEVIPDNGGVPVPIGLDQAEAVSRVAAMDSNVWDVVFDTTDLIIRVSYESGSGETWTRAADQPQFLEIDLADLFLTD